MRYAGDADPLLPIDGEVNTGRLVRSGADGAEIRGAPEDGTEIRGAPADGADRVNDGVEL
jgi:hypothetical protein